jgi:predicted ester cyclase
MVKTGQFGSLVAGFVLALVFSVGLIPPGLAQDSMTPSQVIDKYLVSLVNGDTPQLVALIDGSMKRKNSQLELSPETYSEFLKDHYAGVQPTVEEMIPDGPKMRARVRFDYPSDSSIIEFVLTQVDGQWKITDEIY